MKAIKVKEEYQYPDGLTLPESGAQLSFVSVVFVYDKDGSRHINNTNKIMGAVNNHGFNFTVQPSTTKESMNPSISTEYWPYGLSFEKITKEFIDYVSADTQNI